METDFLRPTGQPSLAHVEISRPVRDFDLKIRGMVPVVVRMYVVSISSKEVTRLGVNLLEEVWSSWRRLDDTCL